jgi:hypothetical protein
VPVPGPASHAVQAARQLLRLQVCCCCGGAAQGAPHLQGGWGSSGADKVAYIVSTQKGAYGSCSGELYLHLMHAMQQQAAWHTGIHGIQGYMQARDTWHTGIHASKGYMAYRDTCKQGIHGIQGYMAQPVHSSSEWHSASSAQAGGSSSGQAGAATLVRGGSSRARSWLCAASSRSCHSRHTSEVQCTARALQPATACGASCASCCSTLHV